MLYVASSISSGTVCSDAPHKSSDHSCSFCILGLRNGLIIVKFVTFLLVSDCG